MTPADLIAFEADIAERFNRAEIPHPVHLANGNETQLIDYFTRNYDAARGDWVCTYWRSHYHCLLAGVPADEVRGAILAGRSITLTFPQYRVVSSAIVGGILPIALGLSLSIKRHDLNTRVHVFCGDMTALTGSYHEVATYARRQNLPISFIIEDNALSVMTDTQSAWGRSPFSTTEYHYRYQNSWPHSGTGTRVVFF